MNIEGFLWARATKQLGKVGRRSMEVCISVTRTKMIDAINWDVDISTMMIIVEKAMIANSVIVPSNTLTVEPTMMDTSQS
tara:strand:- start:127 stop:366 length:240 start_codon:yes stop_codon:yes gene_type:complete